MAITLKYKLYQAANAEATKLKFVDKGVCASYVPEVSTTREDKQAYPHVTFDFGDSQLLLDLDDFKRIAAHVLGHKTNRNNIVQFTVVQGGKALKEGEKS